MVKHTEVSRKTTDEHRVAICSQFGCEYTKRVKPLKFGFLGFGKYPRCKYPLVYVDERIGEIVDGALACLFDKAGLPPKSLLTLIKRNCPEEYNGFINNWVYSITIGRGAKIIVKYMRVMVETYLKQLTTKQLKTLNSFSNAIKRGMDEIIFQHERLLAHLRAHSEMLIDIKELPEPSPKLRYVLNTWVELTEKEAEQLLNAKYDQDIPLSQLKKYYDKIINLGTCWCLLGLPPINTNPRKQKLTAFDRFSAYHEFWKEGLTAKFTKSDINKLKANISDFSKYLKYNSLDIEKVSEKYNSLNRSNRINNVKELNNIFALQRINNYVEPIVYFLKAKYNGLDKNIIQEKWEIRNTNLMNDIIDQLLGYLEEYSFKEDQFHANDLKLLQNFLIAIPILEEEKYVNFNTLKKLTQKFFKGPASKLFLELVDNYLGGRDNRKAFFRERQRKTDYKRMDYSDPELREKFIPKTKWIRIKQYLPFIFKYLKDKYIRKNQRWDFKDDNVDDIVDELFSVIKKEFPEFKKQPDFHKTDRQVIMEILDLIPLLLDDENYGDIDTTEGLYKKIYGEDANANDKFRYRLDLFFGSKSKKDKFLKERQSKITNRYIITHPLHHKRRHLSSIMEFLISKFKKEPWDFEDYTLLNNRELVKIEELLSSIFRNLKTLFKNDFPEDRMDIHSQSRDVLTRLIKAMPIIYRKDDKYKDVYQFSQLYTILENTEEITGNVWELSKIIKEYAFINTKKLNEMIPFQRRWKKNYGKRLARGIKSEFVFVRERIKNIENAELRHILLDFFQKCSIYHFPECIMNPDTPRCSSFKIKGKGTDFIYMHELADFAKLLIRKKFINTNSALGKTLVDLTNEAEKVNSKYIRYPDWFSKKKRMKHPPLLKYILTKLNNALAIESFVCSPTVGLTGHIDLLLYEKGILYIADYKPNLRGENMLRALPQLIGYSYLLLDILKISNPIRCIIFNQESSWEFNPLKIYDEFLKTVKKLKGKHITLDIAWDKILNKLVVRYKQLGF